MRLHPCENTRYGRNRRERGFSILELVTVIAIALIVAAVAIPGFFSMRRYLRIAGDTRDINGVTAQAKMRAAADFTHARLRADLANNAFQLEVWDKTGGAGGAGCWKSDGAAALNPCTNAGTVLRNSLSQGVTFGFGGVGPGAPNPQAAIAQAPACTDGVAGAAGNNNYPNSACIEFNSRGVPVAPNGAPTATDALYVTDGVSVYGATVIISGLIQTWSTPVANQAWQAR